MAVALREAEGGEGVADGVKVLRGLKVFVQVTGSVLVRLSEMLRVPESVWEGVEVGVGVPALWVYDVNEMDGEGEGAFDDVAVRLRL